MSLTDTPNANRLHIALFGRRNSGKSSLINALTGQDTALVSDTPGTTTDLVSKAMEIQGIGPCLFIDTPGFDDEGELGELRISRTLKAIEKTDIALLLCGDTTFSHEKEMLALLKEKNIPVIPVLNKIDIRENSDSLATYIEEECKIRPLLISAKEKTGIEQIRQAILEKLPSDFGQQSITGELVTENDLVLLVMPQDIQAPKGRLILPQVQTIRELLDNTAGLSNKEMLDCQMKEFRRVMDENQKNKGQKIVFIHGKGEGVLRSELLKELKRVYKNCTYQDASFREYGFGATMVTIH